MGSMPESSSDMKVLVVGAGFGGLTAAIECRKRGMSVTLFESSKERRQLGDIISFGSNSGRIFRSWPGVEDELDPVCHHSDGLTFRAFDDDFLCRQIWDAEADWGKRFNGHRGEIHDIVWRHALSIGVEIRLGSKVQEYFETDTEAGVVVNGERISADAVLAADGVRSLARTIVLGFEDKPKSSGYAVYRSWMGTEKLKENPLTAWLADPTIDHHVGWLGPDVHFLVATLQKGTACSWVLTHKDEADVEESWSAPGYVEDAVKTVDGWAPIVHAIIRATPPESLVDWKLVFRDPLPTWVSPKRRIALMGDAAHPFLPTSIQGASQSMEDGVTAAICLELGGKNNVQEGLRAYEKIRYPRVLATQRMGVTNRDNWHKADFNEVKKNPEMVKLPRQDWVLNFDCSKHAYDVYNETVESLRKDPSWKPNPVLESEEYAYAK
ncbi:salicylate hydroxylase [Lophiostoma macrostomum CBS 122681]|uniref:Salicylate hydroxylase n=1 Tax=Lophiostoma macrostomum CBS 122681 TaxID=1314788 RepID=A0A6A6TLH0_9PLEO|nr:salicylate hydroxylase [Lophiostoma macrostomum CBS 122681]